MYHPIKQYSADSDHSNQFAFLLLASLMITLSVVIPQAYAVARTQAIYYVDPINGNDRTNSGTSLGSAFRSISKAHNVVRTINSNMRGDIYVYLRGGTYELTSTLTFTESDRGTNGYNIIYSAYNNEKPVISGGRQITGWVLHDSRLNIYKAYAGRNIETRQLYVNGQRATRARGTKAPTGLTFVIDSGYTANGNVIVDNALPMAQWKNQGDIEFTYNCEYAAPRAIVDTITYDGTTTTITMTQPVWHDATHKGGSSIGREHDPNGAIWYMENAYELLDAEGEWYLNRKTDTFYYKPKVGEDITTSEIIAPVLEELVRIQGADLDHKAGNIQFKGITFAHATWMRPSKVGGVSDAQNNVMREKSGEFLMGAAVNLKYANSVVFERDVFEHLGANGLNMYAGSQDNLVVGSLFTDISGGGIAVGDYSGYADSTNENYMLTSDTRAVLRNNDIFNNYFKIGAEFFSACSIGSTFPVDMDITHNEISYGPYSGIHIGWGWGTGAGTNIKNLKIEKNYIHNLNSILNDGGGIYTNGKTSGDSTNKAGYFNENYIKNVYQSKGYALYDDEADNGNTWYSWKKNVVDSAARYAFQWKNNYNTWDSTYTNVSKKTVGGKNTATNTTVVSGSWPETAQRIIDSAGLQLPYRDIKSTLQIPAGMIFYETFDRMTSGNPPSGWTINNATGDGSVFIGGTNLPDKYLVLSKTGSASGHDIVSSHSFSTLHSGIVELKAKANQTTALALPITLKSGATTAVAIAFNSDGRIAYKKTGETWVNIQSYKAGIWYNFKLEFDVITDTYNFYIDGVKKISGQAFASPVDSIDAFSQVIKGHSKGTEYIDSVRVY